MSKTLTMIPHAFKVAFATPLRAASRRREASLISRFCSTRSQLHNDKEVAARRLRDFDALFPLLLNEVLKTSNFESMLKEATDYFKMSCEYNVPFGKKTRGLTVVETYETVMNSGERTENWRLAAILGWCIEWLQSYLLVCDDVIDRSLTRRGKPCWFRVLDKGIPVQQSSHDAGSAQRRYLIAPGSGSFAMNDTLFLERCVYILLDQYFAESSCYSKLIRLFNERMLQTSMGQQLDMLTAPARLSDNTEHNHIDLDRFTEDRYAHIVRYKTAFYSFCLPVEAALAYTKCAAESQIPAGGAQAAARARAVAALEQGQPAAKALQTVLVELGELFQIQDDVLDCFGDISTTGKVGTDIADGKCSWLAVQALQRASDSQRRQLVAHFGRPEPAHVEAVRSVYQQLQLDCVFAEHERRCYDALVSRIDNFRIDPIGVSTTAEEKQEHEQLASRLRTLLISLLNRTFKRQR